MVKILLDPSMYHPHLTVAEECQKAADLGYEYLGTSHATITGAEVNKIGSHNIVTSFRFMF